MYQESEFPLKYTSCSVQRSLKSQEEEAAVGQLVRSDERTSLSLLARSSMIKARCEGGRRREGEGGRPPCSSRFFKGGQTMTRIFSHCTTSKLEGNALMDLRPFLPDTFLQVLHVRSGKKIHGFRGILLLWVSGNVRASNWTGLWG